jgi:hypothetical protein
MSRKAPVAGPTISLFPFLAVLLCTMGALLVLLVLFSRSAKQGETAEAAGDRDELVRELELARDSLAWRREQLAGVRERTAEDLAKARMQLAGVEENIRALQDELAKLERTAAALASGAGTVVADEETLRGLEARLTSARESLDKARASRDTKPPAYAVVPYEGRHGTHRRPLYIECCGDGVFLQPEGIRLSPGDFEGPPGPGNPLASALRAAREHIVAGQGGTSDPAAQPYPLLLVRPSGVLAYYAAREAIQSWGSDFGYQLIDEDWTLSFPPPDPMLAQVEKRAIEESRARLAEVRPARPTKQPRQYRAAQTRGGVVADGGPSVLGDQSRWDWANSQQAGGSAGALGTGSGAGSGFGSGSGGAGAADGTGGGQRGGSFRGTSASAGVTGGLAGADAGGGQADGAAIGNRSQGGSRFTRGNGAGSAGGDSAGSLAAAGSEGAGVGAAGGTAGSDGSSAAAGSGATGGRSSGVAGSSTATASGSNQGGGGAAGGGGGPAMPGLVQSGGAAGGRAGAAGAASASVSLARSRGSNWASLATQDRPIPLTRPIRVECSRHEFRLLDDSGRRVETRIPVSGDTAAAIDPLVAAVHARVNGWGIAGDRMYWKPQLVLSETADGRSRREDLERLLADSGLDTRSNDGRDVIRPLPPIERAASFVPAR